MPDVVEVLKVRAAATAREMLCMLLKWFPAKHLC